MMVCSSVAHFAAFARVRVQAADADAGARQAEVAAGLGGQLDGQLDFRLREVVRRRSLSGRCVVASATRSQRPRSSWPSSIIAVRSVPASWERNSVWPTNACPARTIASLFTGAVTSASSSRRRQRSRAFAHPGDRGARGGG